MQDAINRFLETLPEKPDFVILDPPREGVHEKALRQINDYGIRHMVYISCKATSFVRDMIYLRREGWQVARYALADLFPGTQHIETVCLLSNRKPDTKVRIDVDLEDYYRIKDAKKNQN